MKKEEFDNKKKLVYDFVTDKEYKPMSVKEMAMVLQLSLIHIFPMEGSLESLNAAVSAAIVMYEMQRQRRHR